MGIEKMIRSVKTLILEIAVPRGVVSDLYLMFPHVSLLFLSERSLRPRGGQATQRRIDNTVVCDLQTGSVGTQMSFRCGLFTTPVVGTQLSA